MKQGELIKIDLRGWASVDRQVISSQVLSQPHKIVFV